MNCLIESKREERVFKLAYNMALKSTSKFRLGAVLIKGNKIVSCGFNLMQKTHPLQQKYSIKKDITLGIHAELHCIIGVSAKDLLNSNMYICRIYKNGLTAMAKPCYACQRLLYEFGIYNIYYTTGNGFDTLTL